MLRFPTTRNTASEAWLQEYDYDDDKEEEDY
jgi:hypothetical protein